MTIYSYAVALIIFFVILSVIGEPYSTWLAAVVLLGALYVDFRKNGKQDLLGTMFVPL